MPAKKLPIGTDAELEFSSRKAMLADENRARKFLELKRWPGGLPICPLCHSEGYALIPKPTSKSPGRKGLKKCKVCRKQFTVRVGTIFEGSKIRIRAYIAVYDGALDHDQYNSPKYAYRMLFKQKLVNKPGQADRVVEFIKPDSDLADLIDTEYWVQKSVEKAKFRATEVVKKVKVAGFKGFRVTPEHSATWKAEDAKNPNKNYGTDVQGYWYWYENWIDRCIELCTAAGDKYK